MSSEHIMPYKTKRKLRPLLFLGQDIGLFNIFLLLFPAEFTHYFYRNCISKLPSYNHCYFLQNYLKKKLIKRSLQFIAIFIKKLHHFKNNKAIIIFIAIFIKILKKKRIKKLIVVTFTKKLHPVLTSHANWSQKQ